MPNTFDWIEIRTGDLETTATFYASLFGWEITEKETADGYDVWIFDTGVAPRVENLRLGLRLQPQPHRRLPRQLGGAGRGGRDHRRRAVSTDIMFLPIEKPNRVTDNFGTVGGGCRKQGGDDSGTTSDAPYTTVGGGYTLGGGFWGGGAVTIGHEIYLPLVLRND